MDDDRYLHLGWIETRLRNAHRDLPLLTLIGQAHFSSPGFAFIEVLGVDHDTARRRKIRSDASEMLMCLGHPVELERGRDIFLIDPIRPRSQHEALAMLAALEDKLT